MGRAATTTATATTQLCLHIHRYHCQSSKHRDKEIRAVESTAKQTHARTTNSARTSIVNDSNFDECLVQKHVRITKFYNQNLFQFDFEWWCSLYVYLWKWTKIHSRIIYRWMGAVATTAATEFFSFRKISCSLVHHMRTNSWMRKSWKIKFSIAHPCVVTHGMFADGKTTISNRKKTHMPL